MESSEDSFAWTSCTSSGTSDSDFKDANMSTTSHTKFEDGDSTDNKKKLQKRLFEEDPDLCEEKSLRKRKKKLKRECEKTSASPRVKHESESDADAELKLHVKQEQASQHTTIPNINGVNHDTAPTSESEFTSSDRKSNKAKKRKRNSSLNTDAKDMIVEDMFSAEETVVEERPSRQRKTSEKLSQESHRKSISRESIDTSNENGKTYSSKEFISHDSSSSDENSKRKKKKKKKRKRDSEPQEVKQIGSERDGTGGRIEETGFQSVKSSQKTTKISDLIQYEDDDSQTGNLNTTNGRRAQMATESTRLKRFIKSNPHLKAITSCDESESITQDDEVWLLKCPHEVDMSSLRGKDLHLDTKCKLKVDGQAYDGCLNEEKGSVAILSCANNQIVINSIPLIGSVTFRKRIPKPHFVEDNVILNNQTNFIPLPDTKRRHPLFGSNYKKAIKIPSAIKERLIHANEPQQEFLEKKKKKRHREEEPTQESAASEPHKKKKKRHQLSLVEEDMPPPKKFKKTKNEVSADTWESEKAIEESLFNF